MAVFRQMPVTLKIMAILFYLNMTQTQGPKLVMSAPEQNELSWAIRSQNVTSFPKLKPVEIDKVGYYKPSNTLNSSRISYQLSSINDTTNHISKEKQPRPVTFKLPIEIIKRHIVSSPNPSKTNESSTTPETNKKRKVKGLVRVKRFLFLPEIFHAVKTIGSEIFGKSSKNNANNGPTKVEVHQVQQIHQAAPPLPIAATTTNPHAAYTQNHMLYNQNNYQLPYQQIPIGHPYYGANNYPPPNPYVPQYYPNQPPNFPNYYPNNFNYYSNNNPNYYSNYQSQNVPNPQINFYPNPQPQNVPNSYLNFYPNSQPQNVPNAYLNLPHNAQPQNVSNSYLNFYPNAQPQVDSNSNLNIYPNVQPQAASKSNLNFQHSAEPQVVPNSYLNFDPDDYQRYNPLDQIYEENLGIDNSNSRDQLDNKNDLYD